MKLLRRSLIALAGLPLAARAGRAQSFGFVWSEWETSAVERRGPDLAAGLLLYFHGFGKPDAYRDPIPNIFIQMAKVATWDVMRINRLMMVDGEAQDDDILALVAMRIAEARRNGYARIVVTGYSRGGWLALLAATLPDVDAAIGIAPGTGSHAPAERERTRDVLAQKLAGARTKRVAAFFFESDPIEEGLNERRAVAVRRGLQSSGASFMVVDRPPDLHGHSAGATGRFVRRYRDCLLRLVLDADQPAGEIQCSRSDGYAAGAEIGFPAPGPVLSLPPDADPGTCPLSGSLGGRRRVWRLSDHGICRGSREVRRLPHGRFRLSRQEGCPAAAMDSRSSLSARRGRWRYRLEAWRRSDHPDGKTQVRDRTRL